MTKSDDVRGGTGRADEAIPDDIVLATLRSGDWARIEELIDRMWYELPARFAEEFIAMLDGSPAEEIAVRPRVVYAGVLAHQFRSGRSDLNLAVMQYSFVASSRRRAGLNPTAPEHPHDQLSIGLTSLTAARLHGDLTASRRIGDALQARLDRSAPAAFPWEPSFVAMRPGQLSMQRGLTLTLLGDFGGAMQLYQRSVAEAGPAPYQHPAGANAAANLAMLAALQDHQQQAHAWLARLVEFGPVPPQIEHLTNLGAKIARAHLAIDRLDRECAEAALSDVGPGTDPVELWPFVAAVHAAFDAAFDQPSAGLETLKAAAFAHNHRLESSELAGHWVFRAYLDLLVDVGEGTVVLALAERAGRPDVTNVPIARTNLLAGRDAAVVGVASRALRRTALTTRDALELRLMLAVAYLRLERPREAVEAFGAALRLKTPAARPATYARIPHDELSSLFEMAGHIEAIPPPPAWKARQLQLVTLTRRELEVLRALAGGVTTQQIADTSSVSVNTVRTHVKSVYRKLNATTRREALFQADRLGLLHE
ncbi:hypothetical protein ASE14_12150 [Agromyces sp. Root81]|uniref:helix-turn-helix transcriptional regulator n=1 Tax=Agromyces sp. Root81 TaxID=1736601 RepID=UPI0007020AA6|nr:LuxR family transcriptional regulator [Agromyces sp. Root81]KRC61588.1 hypothetical protein ASE14_12150 [Agromyces sp. Root81]